MEISTGDERVNFGWSQVWMISAAVDYFISFLSIYTHSVCYLFMCTTFLWLFICFFFMWVKFEELSPCLLFDKHRSSILSHVKSQWSIESGIWARFFSSSLPSLCLALLKTRQRAPWQQEDLCLLTESRKIDARQQNAGGGSPTVSFPCTDAWIAANWRHRRQQHRLRQKYIYWCV